MPRNNRVAKELRTYNLRLEPSEYDKIQKNAASKGIPMNTLLQYIIREYNLENHEGD
jgi:predicted DNA binding CopG/RHH family protein